MNLAIIQARMGSTRLPGKVLMKIGNVGVLNLVTSRMRQSNSVDKIIVATTVNSEDDVLEDYCEELGIISFRGSSEDVLGRFTGAMGTDFQGNVLRVTADCPFVDPHLIDLAFAKFEKLDLDHLGIATGAGVANSDLFKYPDGLDSEWISASALYRANLDASDVLDREHVTSYIWRNSSLCKLGLLEPESDYSDVKLTVDTASDLKNMNGLANLLGENFFESSLEQIVATYRQGVKNGILDVPIENENYEVFFSHEQK